MQTLRACCLSLIWVGCWPIYYICCSCPETIMMQQINLLLHASPFLGPRKLSTSEPKTKQRSHVRRTHVARSLVHTSYARMSRSYPRQQHVRTLVRHVVVHPFGESSKMLLANSWVKHIRVSLQAFFRRELWSRKGHLDIFLDAQALQDYFTCQLGPRSLRCRVNGRA